MNGTPASPATKGRREVLRLAASATGALMLEMALSGCHYDAQRRMQTIARESGVFAPDAWLTITPANEVVLTLDRTEMGQGTMTSHAQLLAEELFVDPALIQVAFAGANREYDNPDFGLQLTGGSSSVHSSYDPLRRAGATAREMIRYAAAERWRVGIDECTATGHGTIEHTPTKRSLTYGELSRDAAKQPFVRAAPHSERRVIGKDIPRKDAHAKSTGGAKFGLDVILPDMLTAIVLRPPRLGARLVRFDGAKAKREPGIIDVLEIPAGVAVVATRYYRARAAQHLVDIEWTDGDRVSSAALMKEYRARLEKEAEEVRSEGKQPATYDVTAQYELPFLAHATMEPQNATAHFRNGRIEIWAPTQAPGLAREDVHRVTGLSYGEITINQTFIGGGFGRRLAQDYVLEAATLAMKLKQPVKVVWSREDDMGHSIYRPMSAHVLRASVAPNGDVRAWFHRTASQSLLVAVGREWVPAVLPNAAPDAMKTLAARSGVALYARQTMHDESTTEGASDFAYAIDNLRVEYASVAQRVPVGFWRSVGYSENTFVVESFLDELAARAKRDPVEMRRALLAKAPRFRGVLDLCVAKANWHGVKSDVPGWFRGVAISKAFGTICAHVADVSVDKSGRWRVHRVTSAIDCGIVVNPEIVRAQVESAIVFGLSALRQKITFVDGAVVEKNFDDYPLWRMHEMPHVDVHIVPSEETPSGVGEAGVPAIGPAVANAIFAATGVRVRTLPMPQVIS